MRDKEIRDQKLYIARSYIKQVLDAFTEAKDVKITLFDYNFDADQLNIEMTRKWAKYVVSFDAETLLNYSPAVITKSIIHDAKQHLRIQEEK